MTPHDIDILVPRDGSEKITATIAYTGPLRAPFEAGQSVATLHIYRGATEALSAPLQTASSMPVGSLAARARDAGLEYLGNLFRKYVLRS